MYILIYICIHKYIHIYIEYMDIQYICSMYTRRGPAREGRQPECSARMCVQLKY